MSNFNGKDGNFRTYKHAHGDLPKMVRETSIATDNTFETILIIMVSRDPTSMGTPVK